MTSTSKKIFKGAILRSFILVANIIVGFFMLPFLVHSLGDEQYGIWVLVGAVVGFYGLLDVGLGSAITRFVVRAVHSDRDSEKEVNIALSTSVFLFSGVGLLSLVVTLVIILLLPQFVASDVNRSLAQLLVAILGLKVSILFPITSFSGMLFAKYRFDIISYIQLFSLVFRTSLIVLVVGYGYGVVAVAIVTSIDALAVSISMVYFARKYFPELRVSVSRVSFDKLKEYYHYGKYTYITTIADKIRFNIDDLVVGAFIGVGAVTHYTIAIALIGYFSQAMDSIFGVISPVLNKYHKLEQWDNLREVFLVITELSAMMSVFIGGLLIVLGASFISIWMGGGYADVYMVLLILCVSSIVANAQRPSVAILYAIAKHKFYAKITSIEAIANIIISVILVQYAGLYGVALGTVIPLLFNKLIMQPIYTCKQLDVSISLYYFILIKYSIFGICFFTLMFLILNRFVVDTYLMLILAACLASAIYVLIVLKFMFNDRTVHYIREILPNRAGFLLKKI